MIMMFLIAATTGLGSTSAVYAATATIVDTEHRIRPERLRPRGSRGAKLADKLHDGIVAVRAAAPSGACGVQQAPRKTICIEPSFMYGLPGSSAERASQCVICHSNCAALLQSLSAVLS